LSDKIAEEVKLEIHIDEETAQGVYANLAVVNHTDAEFIIDFIFTQPQTPRAKVRSRIITSPAHVRRLIAALQENLQHFEKTRIQDLPPPLHGGDYH
jgi:uncharacterized protein DUF3467